MVQIDYEITIFYKEILHLFLALGAFPPNPGRGDKSPSRGGLYILPMVYIHLKQIPMNKQDNQAPHPTISHLETNDSNSTAALFAGQ